MALSNSFGFGGTNGTVVFRRLKDRVGSAASVRWTLRGSRYASSAVSALTTVDRELPVPGSVLRKGARGALPRSLSDADGQRGRGPLSRFSVLAVESRRALARCRQQGRSHRRAFLRRRIRILGALEHSRLQESPPWAPGAPPPFAGGWTLFISAEMASEIESRPVEAFVHRCRTARIGLRRPCAGLHDLQGNRAHAVAEPEAAWIPGSNHGTTPPDWSTASKSKRVNWRDAGAAVLVAIRN